MNCEICKENLPDEILSNGKIFRLFKFEIPKAPYIVLEATSKERGNCGVHVINLIERNEIKLGRGHESDVRISDISVSRLHGLLKFNDGNLILEDNNSKFGTLVRISKSVKVTPA